jgi:hypothetical protein
VAFFSISNLGTFISFAAMAETAAATPWHAAYPKPRNAQPASITRAELLQKFQARQKPGIDFLLIDLRRTDHEVSFNPVMSYPRFGLPKSC